MDRKADRGLSECSDRSKRVLLEGWRALSRSPSSRPVVWLVIVALVVGVAGRADFVLEGLVPPLLYQVDFIQEYLLGRALLAGIDPYQPLPVLAAELMPG